MTAPKPPAAPSYPPWLNTVIALSVLAAFGMAFYAGYCAGRPNTSAAQAEVSHLRADSVVNARKIDSLTKVRRGDSLAVAASSLSYDALKNRYLALQRERTVPAVPVKASQPVQSEAKRPAALGTVQSPDTTTPTVPQVFAACDTLTKALRQALTDCGAQSAVYKAQAAVSESTATAYRKIAPDWLQRKEPEVVGAAAVAELIVLKLLGALK